VSNERPFPRAWRIPRTETADRVVEAFKAAPKFEITASNLSHDQEDKLKAAFTS
jgi:hypothetical protein